MKIAQDDYLKIAVWLGRNETFDSERFKSIKEDFSDGVIWLLGRIFPHPQGFP